MALAGLRPWAKNSRKSRQMTRTSCRAGLGGEPATVRMRAARRLHLSGEVVRIA